MIHYQPFLKNIFFEVLSVYTFVSISGAQHDTSVTKEHTHVRSPVLHPRLLQGIEYGFLCYTV